MFILFGYFSPILKFLAFTGNHSSHQGNEVYQKEVKINDILVNSYVAGYGCSSGILILANQFLSF